VFLSQPLKLGLEFPLFLSVHCSPFCRIRLCGP
jgi:hypothetical protein